jgi:hypothetical protein
MTSITTLTFFRYGSFRDKFWAFQMMQFAHSKLRKVPGQSFYKLMGSGKGKGFNPWPDWSVYALLQVWDRESDACAFLERSELMQEYRARTSEQWTLYLKTMQTKGEWSGLNPFMVHPKLDPSISTIAVITRATIKPSKLLKFWQYVPKAQNPLSRLKGLLYTKGIGEVPIIQMATFSLWSGPEALKAYAYQSREHREAIVRTQRWQWYREELFSRFQPYRSVGTWEGVNPLPELPPKEIEKK